MHSNDYIEKHSYLYYLNVRTKREKFRIYKNANKFVYSLRMLLLVGKKLHISINIAMIVQNLIELKDQPVSMSGRQPFIHSVNHLLLGRHVVCICALDNIMADIDNV